MSSFQQFVYFIQRYTIGTLYPTSKNELSVDYPISPVSITTATLEASTQQVLQSFKSHYGIILLPDIYRVKVDIYASGNQSTTNAQIAVQILVSDTFKFTTSYFPIPYINEPGSMWFDVYIPGAKETDQITLEILAKHGKATGQANTFYLYLNQGNTYMKK